MEPSEAVPLELLQHCADARTHLAASLAAAGAAPASDASLELPLPAADGLEINEAEAARLRRDLSAEIASADDASRRAEGKRITALVELAAWRKRWTRAVAAAGLEAGRSQVVIGAQLDLIEQLRAEIDESLGLEQRIVTMEADIAAFASDVAALARACGRGAGAGEAAAPAERLAALARGAREATAARDRHAALTDRLVASKCRLADAGAARAPWHGLGRSRRLPAPWIAVNWRL